MCVCVCAEPRERRRVDIVASELCNSSSHISLKVISGAGTALVLVGDGEFLPFARTIHPQQISTFRQPRKKLAFATAGPLSAGGSYDLGAQI